MSGEFSSEDKHGLYKAIYERRDVRSQFIERPIEKEKLARILMAAHHAPSVGFMQPWNFILVQSPNVKKEILSAFELANKEAAELFQQQDGKEKANTYRNLKLQGILEAPLNICITCDRDRVGPVALGRTAQPEMDLYSTVCAVQNLWLAARTEGLGVGWVSIIHRQALHDILNIPPNIVPVAYLCVGHTSQFLKEPELANKGWRQRLPLDELVSFNSWSDKFNNQGKRSNNPESLSSDDKELLELIKNIQDTQKYF